MAAPVKPKAAPGAPSRLSSLVSSLPTKTKKIPTMSPASPPFPSDSRLKWRGRKRESNLGNSSKRQKPQENEDDEDDEEDEATPAAAAEEEEDDQEFPGSSNADPVVDLRQSEVLSDGGQRISDFPVVVKHTVNRPHPSVLAIVAAERLSSAGSRTQCSVLLENVSHGQLQVLSAVLPDNPSLNPLLEHDKPPAYVCTPPVLMEGNGVVKQFGDGQFLVVPLHSDWFNPNTVHRLERQVVPHFFSGKSSDYTPERYMTLRNRIVLKYMEKQERRLSFGDCQGIVSGNELFDLSRIVRFLDHWGIINYLAVVGHRGPRIIGSVLREETNGELQVQATPLKSIDSLVHFDRPKSSYRLEDILSLSSSLASGGDVPDLDSRIRERLSEYACSYCSRPLPNLHYQSQKEADIILCSDCFHDAKYISGHSSVDFVRVDSMKDICDLDGDSWTDQETLLLLEALEIHNDNWNEIAEHVGTKSKAQCILHFIQLPMEDGLLENIELPHMAVSCVASKDNQIGKSYPYSNGVCLEECSSGQLPFANSGNPVMALVAFLASTVGPRVAATCASASLSVLTKVDPKVDRMSSESVHTGHNSQGEHTNMGHQKDETVDNPGFHGKKDAASALLPSERVKLAATCGLSAAAMKAKLFADQEEREVQRLVANILNYQLKRLELKLKQFAEVETLLLKECEQVERTRQRLLAERVRIMSTRLPPAGTNIPTAVAATGAMNSSARQTILMPSVGQMNAPSSYGGNLAGHPHMSFMPRQPLFPFGPRLPLSAIHPSSSASPTNVMLPTGMTYNPTPNHPSSRPLSGNHANIG